MKRLFNYFKKKKILALISLIIFVSAIVLTALNPANNPQTGLLTNNLPYNEKIADGVWQLKNREPIRQVLASAKQNSDLNLKENKGGSYKWSVTISSGTKFEFGGVYKDTPEGKVTPEVRITNSAGWFVKYSPGSMNQESGIKYVTPKVKGNVIEWEISDGIIARYTMMQDRVKADYIVDKASSFQRLASSSNKYQIEFNVISGRENSQKSEVSGQELAGELMPGGDIEWFSETVDSGPIQTHFSFPAPVVTDASIKKQVSSIKSEYKFEKVEAGEYELAITISKNALEEAQFPLTVDPVAIDIAAASNATSGGGQRKLLRDAWGNLIALINAGSGNDNVYYKNYNSVTWTDAEIDFDGSSIVIASDIAADLDSTGSAHLAFYYNTSGLQLHYLPLKITRDANNAISSVGTQATFIFELTVLDLNNPSLVVANKDGGAGVEKITIAYSMAASSGSIREEIRFMQCDLADACNVDDNWKNASEEINGNGTCSDSATSGDAGLPNATTCKGTADKILATTASYTIYQTVLTQIPGKPKRNAGSVKKDLNGTFSDLNNLEDGSSGTTDNINSLTTTDYLYVGDLKTFSKISIDIDTTNSNAQTFTTSQYCSANSDVDTTCDTWSSVSNFIDNTATATTTLLDSGDAGLKGSFLFDEPANWVQSTENGTKEYWTRFRPSEALDSTVSLADIYLTDRNSKALLVLGGVDSTDDFGTACVVWDGIGNAGWENNPASAGVPWREGITALDGDGGNWTDTTLYPLATAVDYESNSVYFDF